MKRPSRSSRRSVAVLTQLGGRSRELGTAQRAVRLVLVALLAVPQSLMAAVITVDDLTSTIATNGLCSLSEAINNANADSDTTGGDCAAGSGADTLDLTGDVNLTVPLGLQGLPGIATDVTVSGNGFVIERDAVAPPFGIFNIVPSASTVNLNDVTIRNGATLAYGGGIYWSALGGSVLTVTNSTVSGNTAAGGGGGIVGRTSPGDRLVITNSTVSGNSGYVGGGLLNYGGALELTNSTVSSNSANLVGGGVLNAFGAATLTNSTVSGNIALGGGGGIFNYFAQALLINSILANNPGGNCVYPVTIIDGGNNFDDDGTCGGAFIAPGVDFDAVLADNGGPTKTHALLPGSVAIDAAGACGLATDQRGASRPAGFCDSGAFELQLPCEPDPLSQGYWYRQCLGVPADEGGIDPGRNGRGPSEPLEPNFVKNLMSPVSDILADSMFENGGSCAGGMNADPASDPCEKGVKQTTALLFNLASSRLSGSCMADLSDLGCESTDLTSLVDELATLINSGDADNCRTAVNCAAAVNEGAVALESLSLGVEEAVAQPEVTPEGSGATVRTRSSGAGALSGHARVVVDTLESTVDRLPAVLVAPLFESVEAEPEEVAEESPILTGDDRQILQRHLAVVANSAAPDSALDVSMAALLTALGGGYEPEFRLKIVKSVLHRIDVAYHGLLVGHLEDIRAEAEHLGLEDLTRQATGLLDRLEGGE